MIRRKYLLASLAGIAMAALLAACSGGGSVGTPLNPAHQMGGSVQGVTLNLTPTVSTFAGSATLVNGTGAAARFYQPSGSVSDGTNLYVADASNHAIRKIVLATGAVSTLAGSGAAGAADGIGAAASFNSPADITLTGGMLYVADGWNHKIRTVNPATGAVTTLAGSGVAGAVDATGTAASFNLPIGIATDGANLYVSDMNNSRIRQVVIATGVVSTLVGMAGAGAVDGAVATATVSWPRGLAFSAGTLYVADSRNNKIRKIVLATGTVSSVTGTANTAMPMGAADGTAAAATLKSPVGLATDGTNLYVAEANNNKIRKVVIATGAVSSLTGTANTAMAAGATDGATATAQFWAPTGITFSGTSLYVADELNNTIRKVSLSTGMVSTLAGAPPGTDGIGAAATFFYPVASTTDGVNLYTIDGNAIRKTVIATGEVSTLAGSVFNTYTPGALDGVGAAASFKLPAAITTDGTNLYVADSGNNKIRKIEIATGVVSSLTGLTNLPSTAGALDGAAATAQFNSPSSITTDGTSLYVADAGNNKIRKVAIATGAVSSVTGATNLAVTAGAADGYPAAASFNWPTGITTDGSNLYVADSNNNKIRKVVIATGIVSTLTGPANVAVTAGAVDGAAATASFNWNTAITTDGTNLYVADSGNNKIRKVVIATGAVSSVTGAANTAVVAGFADGSGAAASFAQPQGITNDGHSLYVADTNNSALRKIH